MDNEDSCREASDDDEWQEAYKRSKRKRPETKPKTQEPKQNDEYFFLNDGDDVSIDIEVESKVS